MPTTASAPVPASMLTARGTFAAAVESNDVKGAIDAWCGMRGLTVAPPRKARSRKPAAKK